SRGLLTAGLTDLFSSGLPTLSWGSFLELPLTPIIPRLVRELSPHSTGHVPGWFFYIYAALVLYQLATAYTGNCFVTAYNIIDVGGWRICKVPKPYHVTDCKGVGVRTKVKTVGNE